MNQKTDTYDIARLNYMEMYNATTMVEGVNGFKEIENTILKDFKWQ